MRVMKHPVSHKKTTPCFCHNLFVQLYGMNLVMDTSAILAVLLNEPERPHLIAATKGATLLAPGSVPWEVGNAVSAMFRRKRLTCEQGIAVVRGFEKIPLRLFDPDIASAVRIAADHGIYAYDAYFLEGARRQKCQLVTLDGTLQRAAEYMGIETLEVKR